MRKLLVIAAVLAAVLQTPCPPTAWSEELSLDEVVEGRTSRSEPAIYTFQAPGPGALTIVVRSESNSDISFEVGDAIGQPLAGGQIDYDYQQNFGDEQAVVPIPRAGEYQVKVTCSGGRCSFVIGSTWLPFDALEQPEDPDGSPLTAILLEPDIWYEEDIYMTEGDMADWFKFVADRECELIVRTQANQGDLILEGFHDGEFSQAFAYSDNDNDNNAAKESILVDVEPGEVVYFKLTSWGNDIDYEIRATIAE